MKGRRKSSWPLSTGSSLIELMAAMAILSVILIMLSVALETSLGQFRQSTDRTSNRNSGRAALQWLKQDLTTAFHPKPAGHLQLPTSIPAEQRQFFEARYFLPFEINRTESSDDLFSLPNSATEFARLCFVSHLTEEFLIDPRSNRTGPTPASLPSVIGYYVAYTKNSPMKGDPSASMKLFRHLRPAGAFDGERYAGGFLRHCHEEINDTPSLSRPLNEQNPAAMRQGAFSNSDLPTLLGMFRSDAPQATPQEAAAAWPNLPIPNHLTKPPGNLKPDRGSLEAWQNPGSPIHNTVFPDEALCSNVVRFEIEASRRVGISPNRFETLGAEELNAHLSLNNGEEWPVLVIPDFVKVTIGIVNETTAQRLTRYEDWIVDWSITDPSQWTENRRRIESGLQTFEIRLKVRRSAS